MKFTPHEDYDMLKKQAYALFTLYKNQQKELMRLKNKDYTLSEQNLEHLELALESERDMNDELTRELSMLELKPKEDTEIHFTLDKDKGLNV